MQELKVQSEAKQPICAVGLYRVKHDLEAMENIKRINTKWKISHLILKWFWLPKLKRQLFYADIQQLGR